VFSTPSFIIIPSGIETVVIVFRYCVVQFVFFQDQLVEVESVYVLKLFSVSVVSVSYLGDRVLVAARCGWIVGDVSIVTCLLNFKFSL